MDARMLKILQRHVVACCHVRVGHSRPKSLPGEILTPNKVLRYLLGRQRRGTCLGYRRDVYRGIFWLWIIKDLNVHRLSYRDERSGLDVLRLGRLMLGFFLPTPAWEVP